MKLLPVWSKHIGHYQDLCIQIMLVCGLAPVILPYQYAPWNLHNALFSFWIELCLEIHLNNIH